MNKKSPNLRLAQLSAFLLEQFGEDDSHGLSTRTDMGQAGLTDTRESYISFLRNVNGSNDPAIQERLRLLDNYATFSDAIKQIIDKRNMCENSELTEFIGSGTNSDVYKISIKGQLFAVRIVRTPKHIERYVQSAIAGGGVEGYEQFIALSYEDSAIITEYIPGESIDTLTAEEVASITDEDLIKLVISTIDISKVKIKFDAAPGNLMYNSDSGFTNIDGIPPFLNQIHTSADVMANNFEALAKMLSAHGSFAASAAIESAEYTAIHNNRKSRIALLKRFKSILEELHKQNPKDSTIPEGYRFHEKHVLRHKDTDFMKNMYSDILSN